jgi:hypothetical protein
VAKIIDDAEVIGAKASGGREGQVQRIIHTPFGCVRPVIGFSRESIGFMGTKGAPVRLKAFLPFIHPKKSLYSRK